MIKKEEPIIEASKIHILQVKTLRGNIDSPVEFDPESIKGYKFDFELGTALDKENEFIGLSLMTNIQALGKRDKELEVRGSYTHEIIFKVDNLEEFLKTDEGSVRINAALGSTLVGIAYSTVRGIIYSRTQGTSLGVVMLPVISPLELMGIDTSPSGQSVRAKNEKSKERPDKKPRKAVKTNKS